MSQRIAFTGTRRGLSTEHNQALRRLMRVLSGKDTGVECHHGCCVGADAAFANGARELGWYIIGHPSDLEGYQSAEALAMCDEVNEPLPPLERNHRMVDAVEILIACPRGMAEEGRSGTWATVRYARKYGRPIYLIYPDGEIARENV